MGELPARRGFLEQRMRTRLARKRENMASVHTKSRRGVRRRLHMRLLPRASSRKSAIFQSADSRGRFARNKSRLINANVRKKRRIRWRRGGRVNAAAARRSQYGDPVEPRVSESPKWRKLRRDIPCEDEYKDDE